MRTVVIGVGNAFRGDDAVGLAVAERVRALAPELDVVAAGCPSCSTRGQDRSAPLVDAVSGAGRHGTGSTRPSSPFPRPSSGARHAFGVAERRARART